MKIRSIGLWLLLSGFMLTCTASRSSGADLITPAGLNPGDTFRFVFVTSSLTTGSSGDINVYNNLVAADAAGYTYGGQPITWKAMASTSAINARDNVGGFNTNVPVYLVDGTKIANDLTTSAGGLWSGSILTPLNRLIDGTVLTGDPSVFPSERVWTGTWNDGTGIVPVLGTGGPRYGRYTASNSDWTSYTTQGDKEQSRLYGMSMTFTVVPEPSTYILGLTAAGLIAALARRRSRTASAAAKA